MKNELLFKENCLMSQYDKCHHSSIRVVGIKRQEEQLIIITTNGYITEDNYNLSENQSTLLIEAFPIVLRLAWTKLKPSCWMLWVSLTWWRHQMETFSASLAICAGNSPVPGEFPPQRPVTRSFDVFFDLRLNKRLSKQSWGWWFETLSHPLWRHRNEYRAVNVF